MIPQFLAEDEENTSHNVHIDESSGISMTIQITIIWKNMNNGV